MEAVMFFRKSDLAQDILKAIWMLAAKTSLEFLTWDEFYVACKLISYAQNDIDPNL